MENTILVQRAGVREYDHVLLIEPLVRCLHTEGAQPVFSLWRHRELLAQGAGPGGSGPFQGLGRLHAMPLWSELGPSRQLDCLPPAFCLQGLVCPVVSTGGREGLQASGLLPASQLSLPW